MCIYASLCVNAQTLHAIIFADTNDPTIGVYDKQDYINMTLEVNTIASATGMRLKKYFFEGNICSPTNLSKTLDNLRTSKDDVIIQVMVYVPLTIALLILRCVSAVTMRNISSR